MNSKIQKLITDFSRTISSVSEDRATEILTLLIESIGDSPEPILKFRYVIRALLAVCNSELIKIDEMPNDEIRTFASNMIHALSMDLKRSLETTE